MAEWDIVGFSSITETWRYDAEYWRPIYLENEHLIDKVSEHFEVKKVYNLVRRITGSAFYPSIVEYYSRDEGMPFIRVADLSELSVSQTSMVRISQEIIGQMGQIATVEEGDIVVAKGGSIGEVCLVQPGLGTCAVSRDVIAIETDISMVDSTYLVTFLKSRFGQLQLDRHKSQQVQAHLTFPAIGNVRVVMGSKDIQATVNRLITEALAEQKKAQDLYAEAEYLLVDNLGLNEIDLGPQTTYSASSSLVTNAARFDAEYFQPKYQILLQKIVQTGQSVVLGDWVREPIRRGVQPEYCDEGEIAVINSQHVGKTHVELSSNRLTTLDFCSKSTNKRGIVQRGDVLLNSTGYITIGRCQTLIDNISAFVDGHVSVIRPKLGLDPVYLGVYLNAIPGQLQTEQGWTGSSGQIELRSDVISNFVVWKAPQDTQQKVRNLVEASYQARYNAKALFLEGQQVIEKMMGVERNLLAT